MENTVEKKLTLGEKRVRVDFNVSGSDTVSNIKSKSAEIINDLEAIKNDELSKTSNLKNEAPDQVKHSSGEKLRLIALAQTTYEEAAMWAVKAATC